MHLRFLKERLDGEKVNMSIFGFAKHRGEKDACILCEIIPYTALNMTFASLSNQDCSLKSLIVRRRTL
jgi:hypothetical protein